MKVGVVHLSDMHFKAGRNEIVGYAQQVVDPLRGFLPDLAELFIVISGDIAFSGQEDQYAVAATFLRRLVDEIARDSQLPVHLVAAPGNHDCDLSQSGKARAAIVRMAIAEGQEALDDESI